MACLTESAALVRVYPGTRARHPFSVACFRQFDPGKCQWRTQYVRAIRTSDADSNGPQLTQGRNKTLSGILQHRSDSIDAEQNQ